MSHGERTMNNPSESRYPSRFPWVAALGLGSSLRRFSPETAANLSLLLPLCFHTGIVCCFGSRVIIAFFGWPLCRRVIRRSSPRAHATLAMTAQRWQTEPFSMQMHVRKNRNAGQAKPATGKPPDPSGSTQKPKSASLKSETPHEIGGQHL